MELRAQPASILYMSRPGNDQRVARAAQVRGYLRGLSVQEVQSLLDHEQSGENRAPFLTLLSNRLITMEHQES